MADKKISALTAATTPLGGTEVLPIVQSGSTVKVSVANLTAGRTISADAMAIGATTPFSKFSVNSNGVGIVANYTDNVAQGLVLATGAGYFGFYNPNSGAIAFRDSTNSSSYVTITGVGDVGVGTGTPGAPFEVNRALGTFSPTGNSIAILNNPTAGGQSPLDWVINGTLRSRIRTDFTGAVAYVANGGDHSFFTGGDASVGTEQMRVATTGNITATTGNVVLGTAGKGITTGGATALGLGVNGTVDAVTIDTAKNVGVGTATPTAGSMSNGAILNAGVFATLRGSVASSSGVPVTIAVANQGHQLATYIVSCGVSSAAPDFYSAVSIVSADNNVLRITPLQTAAFLTISISGTDIQATQTSGGSPNILFSVTRVA